MLDEPGLRIINNKILIKLTCFSWERWVSTIWALSTSTSNGATKIADEVKNIHKTLRDKLYKPVNNI